jgi:hypothetical protein
MDMEDDSDTHSLDTWTPLRTVSAQLLRRLHESNAHSPEATGERSDPHGDKDPRREDRADRKDDDCYIRHRLKEIAAFEDQASGRVPRRRKTKIAHTTATSGAVKLTEPRQQITDAMLRSKQR